MLNEDDYENLKLSLVDSQVLFDKLNTVANQFLDLDFDESGLYINEENRLKRHWLKISSKITDALSLALGQYNIELLQNKSLDDRILIFIIKKNDELIKFRINYSECDSLSISKMS